MADAILKFAKKAAILVLGGLPLASVVMMTSALLAAQQPKPPAPAVPQPAAKAADTADVPRPDVQEIIRRFAAREKEFKVARDNYTYRQTVKVEELSEDGDVTGVYQMQEDVIFTPKGERIEKVTYAPLSTLRKVGLSPEDERDLRNVQPFVLTSDDLYKYNVRTRGAPRWMS